MVRKKALTRQDRRQIQLEKSLKSQSLTPIHGRLKTWDEIPSWQQDNEYILSAYREATGSITRSFQSLAYVHNETVNIYSHLFGAAFFSLAPFYLYQVLHVHYIRATLEDLVVFFTFFYGVAVCFLLSSTYVIFFISSPPRQTYAFYLVTATAIISYPTIVQRYRRLAISSTILALSS